MNTNNNQQKDYLTNMIGADLIKAKELDAETKKKAHAGKTFWQILRKLLSYILPVNFRERAGLDDDAKVTKKLQVVITIDEILETAKKHNWGLCTKDGFIYVYNGKYWQEVKPENFKPFLAYAAIKMGVPVFDAKYHLFKEELYKQFWASSSLPIPESESSKKATLINLLNGTFEITAEKQVLREPRQNDFLTHLLPFEYNPNAECPIFNKYLNRVVPDIDCQKVLSEYLGYIFIRDLKLEKVLILCGSGSNGKSVFFEIVNALLGRENICSYSLQNLTKSEGYQRAKLSNKLLNYASEINGVREASIFKQLVSGEPVEARQIYGDPFMMENYAKLMFNCNEPPKDVENTEAFKRRLLLTPFNQTIEEWEQDPELAKKIIATELSGVFNWVLDGLRRLQEQKKFTESAEIKALMDIYRRESDNVAIFIDEEGYTKSADEFISLKDLYNRYRIFCQENGYYPCVSSRDMSNRFSKAGFFIKRIAQGRVVYAKK